MQHEPQPDETATPWVEALGLQDRPADPVLDALVRLLAQAADAPMAALWITDGRQQRFAATHGLDADDFPAVVRSHVQQAGLDAEFAPVDVGAVTTTRKSWMAPTEVVAKTRGAVARKVDS